MRIWFCFGAIVLVSYSHRMTPTTTANGLSAVAPLGRPTEFVPSSVPDIKLAVRRWGPLPSSPTKAVLVVHHGGIGWHSGYFDVLGRALQKHDIAVLAYDMVGSGYSDALDPPGRQCFESMDRLDQDLRCMMQFAKDEYNGVPVFCLGESFGGMVLLHHILQSDGDAPAQGYLLCGPVVRVREEMLPPAPVQAIVQFVSRFFPHLRMPGVDFMTTFDEAFGDPRWAKAGREDPFVKEAANTPPRLGMAASVLRASSTIYASFERIQAPLAIFIGDKDVRVYVPDSEKLYKESSSTDKSLVMVKDGHHQLFQDTLEVTSRLTEQIKDWILARV